MKADPPDSPATRTAGTRVFTVLLVAFVSGTAALLYELVFFRSLGLVFGVAIHAVAAVVASFLGGLGLGAWLFGRFGSRLPAWRTYALLEFGIAAFGLASPFLFPALGRVLPTLLGDTSAADPRYGLTACGLSFLLLLWPTVLMGGTFPVLGRIIAEGQAQPAGRIGLMYGVNTLGAATGTMLAAFVVLPQLGLLGASHLAAGLNFAVGCLALTRADPPLAVSSTPHSSSWQPAVRRTPLTTAFLIGFASIALQVLGTRILVSVLGGSVYAFASVLFVFLAGIGLGGATGCSCLAARRQPLNTLAVICILMAASVGLGVFLLGWRLHEGDILAGARNIGLPPDTTLFGFAKSAVFLAALALLPFTLLSGAFLPALTRWIRHDSAVTLMGGLGSLVASNTVGAILGSLVAGFWLLPAVGLRGGLAVIAAVAVIAGLLLLRASRRNGEPRQWMPLAVAATLALAGCFVGLRPGEPPGLEFAVRTVSYTEDAVAAVKVEEHDARGEELPVRSLRINGKVVASSLFIDRRLQQILGFIPTLVHPAPKRILSIALGTGMSSGALAMSGAESVEIVELSSGVIDASPAFDVWNRKVDRRPNVTLVYDDGRSFLRRSQDTYDIITADPIHPWVAGSAYLFTREYYQLAREHLNEGGLMAQWIPLYQLSTQDIAGIAKTFMSVFPEVSAWITGYDMVLLGSNGPLEIDPEIVRRRMQREPVRGALRDIAVHGVEDLLGCWMAGPDKLRELAALAPEPITDRHPWIEFSAPRSVNKGYATDVMLLLVDDPDNDPENDPGQDGDRLPLISSTPSGIAQAIHKTNVALREAARRFVDTARTGAYASARDTYTETIRRGIE